MIDRLRFSLAALATIAGLLATVATTQAQSPGFASWDKDARPGSVELNAASEQGKHAFVLFWRQNDEPTQRMSAVLQSAVAKLGNEAIVVNVHVTDPAESATVTLFGVDRAPIPLVAAVAPNGAVTKAWPLTLQEKQVSEGIVSESTARCLKALQDQKLVLLCIQNAEMADSVAAWESVQGVKANSSFAAAMEVVQLDPSDARESGFLKTLEVNPNTSEAVTIVLAPPGRPLARFDGAVTTEEIVATVTAVQSGCCPGGKCGPGGCCPNGSCGPDK